MNFSSTRFQIDPASGLSLPEKMQFGEQRDGSILRPNGELMTPDDRLHIMTQYESLPVNLEGDSLKEFLSNHPICIVRADTGSGKSTQIPKMLAELFPGMQIVVTQPRVVAAMELANRVGKERIIHSGNPLDDISGFYNPEGKIGYRTGSGNSFKKISNISYHTDGLELKRQIHGHCPDILVIDEAHGYSVSVEMLMKLYRDLHMKNKNIRLVIMSATIDATNIKKFFDLDIPEKTIDGRQYPIHHEHKPGKDPADIVLSLVGGNTGKGDTHTKNGYVGGDILVFVPGKKEINDLITRISSQTNQIEALPLHAQISPEEKAYALRKNPDGKQRVIIATNVAQESLTPEGIKTVISIGEVKVMYTNQGIQELHTKDISYFDYKQQAGRGGRQEEGDAISTNRKSPEELIKEAVPPITRQALHSEILDLEMIRKNEKLPQKGRKLSLTQREKIDQTWSLAQAVNNTEKPPFVHRVDRANLSFAYKELQEMGALDRNREITSLGAALTKLPLSVHTGRMLLESISRDCLLEMLPIIAILEKKSFLHKDGKWQEMKMEGKEHGDLFALSSLLTFFLRSDHTDGELTRLVSLGVSSEEIAMYKKNEIRTPLGLSVDLSPLGVKNQQLHAIAYLIDDLKRRLPSIDSRASDLLFQSSNTLKRNAGESEKKKEKQKQIHAQKVCITTGFLSHIFRQKYDQKKKKGLQRKEGEVQKMHLIHQSTLDEFLQGNSSVFEVNTQKKSSGEMLFVGQPFRIVPKDGDAVSIALYLTPIDHDILEEAVHYSSYDSAFALSTYDVSDEKSIVSYDLQKAGYIEKLPQLTTKSQKKDYFAKHCLLSLVIEENPDIHEYVAGLTPIRQAIFEKEVLPRVISHHRDSINPDNLELTEQIFIHHPQIKKELEKPSDFFIRSFVSGQVDTFEKAVLAIDESKNSRPYLEQKEEYETDIRGLKTLASKRKLYAEKVLPSFLIEKNPHIQKYMDTLSLEQKIIFRKYILPKLIDGHITRISPNGLEKTERSFIGDTDILNDLMDSKDPFLSHFVSGKILNMSDVLKFIDYGEKPADFVGPIKPDNWIDENLSRALYHKKTEYIALASKARHVFLNNEKFLSISQVKKKTVQRIYDHLLSTNAQTKLTKIQGQLSALSESERQKITLGIKEFQRVYAHDLEKQQLAQTKLFSLEIIEKIFREEKVGVLNLLTEYLGNLDGFITRSECAEIIAHYNYSRTSNSVSKKKKKDPFEEKILPILRKVKQKILQNNKPTQNLIELDPIIDRLDATLYTLFSPQFEPSYFAHGVQPKLSELRNNLIRHSHTREEFFDTLKRGFQKFSYAHMKGGEELSSLVEKYEGLLIQLEPYVVHYLDDGNSLEDRRMNIRNMLDIEMVEDHMRSLKWLSAELKETQTKIKNMLS